LIGRRSLSLALAIDLQAGVRGTAVVPAKAGTHNHRISFCEDCLLLNTTDGFRGMGPPPGRRGGGVSGFLPSPGGCTARTLSSPARKNISLFRISDLPYGADIPPRHEGRTRRHETRGGMRWTWGCRQTCGTLRGRRNRVVPTPRRWRQVSRRLQRPCCGAMVANKHWLTKESAYKP